ncbi:hypothetical protein CgunFtcFv8_007416 [Champsocephalus gunnari]|uniref:Uncharacterized protein n=1 Tax=Champsocephalus gunnari TaxID=52237 RepID=A0AAN8CGX2_CHAGU|nr:hypothetical protein CgunFtcFv8_007416 [Champsocephalus gunnari]
MSWWNSLSAGLSPPAWLPLKGHQRSAETTRSHGLSVSAWEDMCMHKGERDRTSQREDDMPTIVLTGQFHAEGPDGPLASDSTGHWPVLVLGLAPFPSI